MKHHENCEFDGFDWWCAPECPVWKWVCALCMVVVAAVLAFSMSRG